MGMAGIPQNTQEMMELKLLEFPRVWVYYHRKSAEFV